MDRTKCEHGVFNCYSCEIDSRDARVAKLEEALRDFADCGSDIGAETVRAWASDALEGK